MLVPFLPTLREDGRFNVSLRDWQRLQVILQTPGAADGLRQLQTVMSSLLVSSRDQRRAFAATGFRSRHSAISSAEPFGCRAIPPSGAKVDGNGR